jgi:hypothetical protein
MELDRRQFILALGRAASVARPPRGIHHSVGNSVAREFSFRRNGRIVAFIASSSTDDDVAALIR